MKMTLPNKAAAVVTMFLVLGVIASCNVAPVQDAAQADTSAQPASPAPAAAPAAETTTTQQAAAAPQQQTAPAPVAAKKVDRSAIYLGSDGRMAGTGDPSATVSEAYRLGQSPHPQALSAPGLPKDKFGLVDWVAMVDQQTITPVGSLQPGAPEIPPFDMSVVIKAKGDFVNDVLFQHKTHTYWLSCEICHNGIFIMAKGQNKMSMQEISQGQWCGRCHGKVSFPLTDCVRCHSQPKQ